jgi:hypothetical protein
MVIYPCEILVKKAFCFDLRKNLLLYLETKNLFKSENYLLCVAQKTTYFKSKFIPYILDVYI